jgi:hypothetical protein
MPAKVFLLDVPPLLTISKLRGWLDRFSIASISSRLRREGLCIQIETSALLEANKIACVLESIYMGCGPLTVVRGGTKEGNALQRFFPTSLHGEIA